MSGQSQNAYPVAGEIIDGKYQIERMLGEGGMGAVAKAIHLLLRAPVALKFMNPQYVSFPGAVERFLNEGVASKAIKSEHVVQVSDVGKLPSGAPYLVMDCLEGKDLSELLADDGEPGLPIERVVHFMAQILRGLQVAHAIGIIHRDMKPSNCFVVRHEGQPDFVKILDFGISKVAQQGSASLTQTNSALGTPLYMSPEQARSPRDVDARSDIYSVGVIFYELLTGRTPFTSDTGEFTEILFKLFTADVPRIEAVRSDISPELAEVVHKSLAREVADRYQSVGDFAAALEPFAGAQTRSVIERIKHYKPEARSSIVPRPQNGPSSTFAFSALGQVTKQHVASPAGDTRATPSEATAKTQASYPDLAEHAPQNHPHAARGATQVMAQTPQPAMPPAQQSQPNQADQPGVRTNLAVARDVADTGDAQFGPGTTGASAPTKRSPLVYALVPIALIAVVGTLLGVKGLGGGVKPDNAGNAGTGTGLVQTSATESVPSPATAIVTPPPGPSSVEVKDAGVAIATAPTSPTSPTIKLAPPPASVKPNQNPNPNPNPNPHTNVLENEAVH